ncbi:glycosyltransferase family 2 protein [Sutcliffiella halmapala]
METKNTVNRMPFFSIVICTYNTGEYLVSAIESVLSQTMENWELIIVDDWSTDETKDILQLYAHTPNIQIIQEEYNKGKAACLNRALEKARGQWFLELDADDWLDWDCLTHVTLFIEKISNKTGFIYGNYLEWRERSRDKKVFYAGVRRGPADFHMYKYLENAIPLAPRIYRVSSLRSVGGWRVHDIYDGRLFEDVYIACVLATQFSVEHIDQVLYHRRLRRNSISASVGNKFAAWRKWLEQELDM